MQLQKTAAAQRPRALEAVRQFTPSWFSSVMSTGIVGLLIAGFPYDAPAKLQIGWAFWWLALALFGVFSVMMAGRFILFPETIRPLMMHPIQCMFIGCIPMSLSVIINGFPRFLAHYWDEDRVASAAVALWAVNATLAVLSALLIPWFMFTAHSHSFDSVTAVWLLPLVPGVVASNTGAVVAQGCSDAAMQRIVLACGYLWGLSVPLSFMVITLYLARLAVFKLPPRELIVSAFLPVGPLAMSANALLNISTALIRTADASTGDLLLPWAPAFEIVTSYTSLLLWGAAAWWLKMAVASVASTLRQLPFNLGWWGFVFPLGVFSQATVTLSLPSKLDSGALRVAGAAFSALTLALWCMVTAYTLRHGYKGQLFRAPCLLEPHNKASWREDKAGVEEGSPDLGVEADAANSLEGGAGPGLGMGESPPLRCEGSSSGSGKAGPHEA